MSIVQMLFSAGGRIRRRDYWLWSIILSLGTHAGYFTAHQLLTGHPASQYFTDLGGWISLKPTPFNLVIICIMLVVQWPGICLMAKRWHDRNRPGYIAGVVLVVSWLGVFLQRYFSPGAHLNWPAFWIISFVVLGFSVWVFIDCGCLDGTKGPNKYGLSPKQIPAPVDVF